MALNNVGSSLLMTDQPDAARAEYLAALAIRRAAGDAFGEGMTLHNLGEVEEDVGNLTEAASWYEAALTRFERVGNLRGEARALHKLGVVSMERGDGEQARAHWRRALEVFEAVGDPEADEVQALLDGREPE